MKISIVKKDVKISNNNSKNSNSCSSSTVRKEQPLKKRDKPTDEILDSGLRLGKYHFFYHYYLY